MSSLTMADLQYSRDESPSLARFVEAPDTTLDTNWLGVVWRPMVDLSTSPYTPVKVRNILHLQRMLGGGGAVETRPWFAILSVSGLRVQALRHSGLTAYHCDDPAQLPIPLRSPGWQRLVEAMDAWDSLSTLDRTRVVALLNQLTMQRAVLGLVGRVKASARDRDEEHLLYETTRAVHRLAPKERIGPEVFTLLAEEGRDAGLRVLASAQIIAHEVRVNREVTSALRWVTHGEEQLGRLRGEVAPWLEALVASRFHRAAALAAFRGKDWSGAQYHLSSAKEQDEVLHELADDMLTRQLADENRKILLESLLKAATAAPQPTEEVDEFAGALLSLDPFDPDSHLVVGDARVAQGRIEEAAHHYEDAGQLGTLLGALGQYRAGCCWEFLGREHRALRAFCRTIEMDPAAMAARRRLATLASRVELGNDAIGARTCAKLPSTC